MIKATVLLHYYCFVYLKGIELFIEKRILNVNFELAAPPENHFFLGLKFKIIFEITLTFIQGVYCSSDTDTPT